MHSSSNKSREMRSTLRHTVFISFYNKPKPCHMSNLNCFSLKSYLSVFLTTCSTSKEDRQNESKKKLQNTLLTHQYVEKELERKIHELEERMISLAKQKRLPEAKNAALERHGCVQKHAKNQGLLQFTQNLLDSIADTHVMNDTVATLSEAQTLFNTIDAPKIYKKFNKLANQYTTFRQDIDDVQEQMSERLQVDTPVQDDAELQTWYAELEALARDTPPSLEATILPNVPASTPTLGTPAPRHSVAAAYANAGLM